MTTVNNAPVLTGKKAILGAGKEDFTYTINVKGFTGLLAGFSDLDGDALSVANLTANNGTLTFNISKNTWTFTPEANFNGLVTLNYDVVDGKGGITHATQTFTIGAVNDAPTDINVVATNVNGVSSLGTSIATISTTDIDNTTGFTYALVGGAGDADNAIFSIEGNQLKINSATVPLKETYTIRLQTTDTGGLSYQKIITLSNNIAKPPIPPAQGNFTTGDANGDGTLDQNQTSVASIQASSEGVWATFQADSTLGDTGIEIQNLSLLPFSGGLPGFAMTPYGAFSYDIKLPSSTDSLPRSVTMTLYLSGSWSLTGSGYLNSTTGDVVNGVWKMDSEGVWHDIATTKTIQDGKLVMTYTLTDGDPLTDSDNIQNGMIVDPIVVGQNFAAPTLSWNDTGIQGDSLTNDDTITVGGLLNGSQWYYRINDSDWQLGNGNSFSLSGDGNKDIRVQQVDTNGNRSVEANLTITLDTTGPNSPTVWTHGSRTNSGLVGVTGLENGATWQYKLSQQDEWHNGEGNSFSVPGDGAWTVIARQMDAAGNISNINGTSFFLDKTAPSFSYSYVEGYNEAVWHDLFFGGYWTYDGPRHSGFYLVNASDMSGIFDAVITADDITHDMGHNHPWYGYDLGPNNFVYVTDTQLSSFTIDVVDNLFNVASTGIVPGLPNISLLNDTGPQDNVTQDGRVLVENLITGGTWQFKVNEGDWQTGVGNSFTLTGDGAKNVWVKQISPAGISSSASNLSVVVDTSAPSSPHLSWIDTGEKDGVFTNNGKVAVGNLESDAVWQYSVNGSEWISGWGNSIQLTGNGAKILEVRQMDGAGNWSNTASTGFVLDKIALMPHTFHAQFGVDFIGTGSKTTIDKVSVFGLEPGASWRYANVNTWHATSQTTNGITFGDFEWINVNVNSDSDEQWFTVYRNNSPSIPEVNIFYNPQLNTGYHIDGVSMDLINTWIVQQKDLAGNISGNRMTSFTTISRGDEVVNQIINEIRPTPEQLRDLLIVKDIIIITTSAYSLNWFGVIAGINELAKDHGYNTAQYYSPTLSAISTAVTLWHGIPSLSPNDSLSSYLADVGYPATSNNVDAFMSQYFWPAGISGQEVNLGLIDPTPEKKDDVMTISIANLPAGWLLNEGTREEDGSWSIQTNDPSSLVVTSLNDFFGALLLSINESWTQADGTASSLVIQNNLEMYAPNNPIIAWSGDDNLTGGSGGDLFVIGNNSREIKIFNFDTTSDRIDLIGYSNVFSSLEDLRNGFSVDENGNATIVLGDTNSVVLVGLRPEMLNNIEIVFNETPVMFNQNTMGVMDGALLPLAGFVENSGSIELNAINSMAYLQLVTDVVTLQGGGQVILSDNVSNIISGSSPLTKLINLDNTLSGAGSLGAGVMALDNQGIIDANGTHLMLVDTGFNEIVNSGTLEASGTGGLYINSSLLNKGLLWANGGNITLMGAVSGTGSATIDGVATIEFAAASSTNISFADTATATLKLGESAHFNGTLSGWNNDDSLYLRDIIGDSATLGYAAETGVLSVTDGAHTAQITLIGQYDASLFNLTTDATTGGAVIQIA